MYIAKQVCYLQAVIIIHTNSDENMQARAQVVSKLSCIFVLLRTFPTSSARWAFETQAVSVGCFDIFHRSISLLRLPTWLTDFHPSTGWMTSAFALRTLEQKVCSFSDLKGWRFPRRKFAASLSEKSSLFLVSAQFPAGLRVLHCEFGICRETSC